MFAANNNNPFGAHAFAGFGGFGFGYGGLGEPRAPLVKTLTPELSEARKRLHIARSNLEFLTGKQHPDLSKPAIKKILNKIFKRDPNILLPITSDFYSLGKNLSPLMKSIKIIPKKREGNQAFMYPPFKKSELKEITRMIKTCKRLRYLDVVKITDLKPFLLKPLRKLPALDCLVLQLEVRYLIKNLPFSAFLAQIKRLHLRINSSEEEESDEDEPIDQTIDSLGFVPSFTKFSREMSSKLKNLKHLEFRFVAQKIHGGELGVSAFLSSFNFPKLEKFFYTFYVTNFTLDVQKFQPFLKKVEHFGIFADRVYGLHDSLKINSQLFFFVAEDCKINDADIIKNCTSLKKLSARTCYLSSFQDEKTQSYEISPALESLNMMVAQCDDDLQEKEVNSWLLALQNLPVLKTFNLTIWPWGPKSYEKVKKLHEKEALKHLESYQLSITDYERIKLKKDMLEDTAELLKEVGHVPQIGFMFKRATNALDNVNFWRRLEENKNLKSLFFSVPEGRNEYKLDFPYQKLAGLGNLERLEIQIPPGFEEARILRQMPKLEKLKYFAVVSSEPRFWNQQLIVTKFN